MACGAPCRYAAENLKNMVEIQPAFVYYAKKPTGLRSSMPEPAFEIWGKKLSKPVYPSKS